VVVSGDTLYSISRRYGVTLDALRLANCLEGDRINTGQQLWVPAGAAPPSQPSTPDPDEPTPAGPTIDPTLAVIADPCSNPLARITSPREGEQVDGLFWLVGTADIPNFMRYEIDVRRDGSSTWMHLGSDRTRVVNGQLAQIDTSRFGSGAFWVRLSVVDNTYNYPPRCTVLLYFP
jgi:LysM repeat protein